MAETGEGPPDPPMALGMAGAAFREHRGGQTTAETAAVRLSSTAFGVAGEAFREHGGGRTVAETAKVHLNSQSVRSGRRGISRAQEGGADGGRNRNHPLEPSGRSEWQGRHLASTEEGRLSLQGVRSGSGGNSWAQRKADDGQHRNRPFEPPGRSEWQEWRFVRAMEGRRWPKPQLSPEPLGRSEWQGRQFVSAEEGRRWPKPQPSA
jgi:hypothetical protein